MIDFNALYYLKPMDSVFTSQIQEIEPDSEQEGRVWIFLEDTLFYPEGGGQPGDTGWLDEISVLDSRMRNGKPGILVESNTFSVGQRVEGRINFSRRFEFMQQHTGEHLISGWAHQLYGCENVGFHISETDMTIDFQIPLDQEQVMEIEGRANETVFNNLPVQILFPTPQELPKIDYRSKKALEGDVRLVQVEGVDCCACCGTHLTRTGEIGLIKIARTEPYKRGVRLTIFCGSRALRDYQHLQRQAEQLSGHLSAPARDLIPAWESREQKSGEVALQLNQTLHLLLDSLLPEKASSEDSFLWWNCPIPAGEMKDLGKRAGEKIKGVSALIRQVDDGTYDYVLTSSDDQAQAVHDSWKNDLTVQGGGHGGFFRGRLLGTEENLYSTIRDSLNKVKVVGSPE